MQTSKSQYSYNAIIAINNYNQGFFIKWINPEEWMVTEYEEFDILKEYDYAFNEKYKNKKIIAGLYYANMHGKYCKGSYCNCGAKDCFYSYWTLEKLIKSV